MEILELTVRLHPIRNWNVISNSFFARLFVINNLEFSMDPTIAYVTKLVVASGHVDDVTATEGDGVLVVPSTGSLMPAVTATINVIID